MEEPNNIQRLYPGTGESTGLIPERENDASFYDQVGATWMYDNMIRDASWHNWMVGDNHTIDPEFDPFAGDYLKGYEGFEDHFMGVANAEQATRMKTWVDDHRKWQAKAAEASLVAGFVGELFKPENLALAALAPVTGGGGWAAAVGRTMLAETAYATALEFGIKSNVNPMITTEERLMNVGAATFFSGVLMGAGKGMVGGVNAASLRPKFEQATLRFHEQAAAVNGTPNRFKIPVPQRLASSGGAENYVEVVRHAAGGTSYRSTKAIRDGMKKEISKMGLAMKPGRLRDLVQNGDLEEALDEVLVRMKKGSNTVDDIFDLDPADFDYYAMARENIDDPESVMSVIMTRADPTAPMLSLNRRQLMHYWKMWENGQDPAGIDGAYNHNPRVTPARLRGVDFEDYDDFEEFVMRHEIAHSVRHEEALEEFGAQYRTDPEVEARIENEANEYAARDFLEYREQRNAGLKVQYNSQFMQLADGWANNLPSKGQKLLGDTIQERLSNSPFESLMRRAGTDTMKDLVLSMVGDHSVTSTARAAGRKMGSSIHQLAKTHEGKAYELDYDLQQLWHEYRGVEPTVVMEADLSRLRHRKSFEEFINLASKAYMKGEVTSNTFVNQGADRIKKFFEHFESEASRSGLLNMQNPRLYDGMIRELDEDIEFTSRRDDMSPEEKDIDIGQLQSRKRQLEALKDIASTKNEATNFFSRVWDNSAIIKHRDHLEQMVYESFLREPYVVVRQVDSRGGWQYVRVETSPTSARQRAKDWIDSVLSEDQVTSYGNRPGELQSRSIPISNKDLIDLNINGETVDFIITDPNVIARRYSSTMGSRIETSNRFKGVRSYEKPDEVFAKNLKVALDEERSRGTKKRDIKKMERDANYLFAALNHQIQTDPGRLDISSATFIKNLTHMSTLGVSGFTQIPEMATIAMTNGTERFMRQLGREFDDTHKAYAKTMTRKQLLRAGALQDMVMGMANVKFGEQMTDPFLVTAGGRARRGMQQVAMGSQRFTNNFFMMNMMTPITTQFKMMSGAISQDRFAHGLVAKFGLGDAEGRVAKRGAKETAEDIEFLDRTNWTKNMQERIAKEIDKNWANSYDPDVDLFSMDTSKWADRQAAKEFEAGLTTEVETQILVAGLNDKWKVMDGVVHIPENSMTSKLFPAEKGWKRDGSYIRLHSPMYSLPFMYLSFSLAATRRILSPLMRNEMKAPIVGMIAGVSAAWLADDLKRAWKFQDYTPTSTERTMSALFKSNFVGILPEWYERSANMTAAIGQDMGVDLNVLRPAHVRWMEMDSAGEQIMSENIGPTGSKIHRAITEDGSTAPLNSLIPFNQMIGVSWILRELDPLGKLINDN